MSVASASKSQTSFPDWSTDYEDEMEVTDHSIDPQLAADQFWLPPWLSNPSALIDQPETASSRLQCETAHECMPFLLSGHDDPDIPVHLNEHGLRRLDRSTHIRYLKNALGEYPGRYAGYDASRPWLVYWSLTGLALLGDDISEYREE